MISSGNFICSSSNICISSPVLGNIYHETWGSLHCHNPCSNQSRFHKKLPWSTSLILLSPQYSDKKPCQKSARVGFLSSCPVKELHSHTQELSLLGCVVVDVGSQMELSMKTLVHLFQAGITHPLPTFLLRHKCVQPHTELVNQAYGT